MSIVRAAKHRSSHELQRFARIYAAVIERAADDDTLDVGFPGGHEGFDIGDPSDAARSDHRDANGAGECRGGGNIQTLKQAIAIDVGEQDRGNTGVLEFAAKVAGSDLRGLRPT